MVSVLVVGIGEVGSAIYEIIRESGLYDLYGYDVDPSRTKNRLDAIPKKVDYLHICIPFTNREKFIKIAESYINNYNPDITIIHSTVAPGTTREIYTRTKKPIVFSPVRGKHPYLKEHIKYWPKWIAAPDKNFVETARKHFEALGLHVKVSDNLESLELAKLFETIYRGLLIAWWQEMHRITKYFGGDMKVITEFIGEIHERLKDKPPMFPGYIGGHCVIPNTKILLSVYKSKFLEAILESNDLRKKELENPEIRREVDELKELIKKYIVKEYYEGKTPDDSG